MSSAAASHGRALRILLLSKYSRLGASTRLRSLQYVPYLRARGYEIVHRPLFDDVYLKNLYAGTGRSKTAILKRYMSRVIDLLRAGRFDLLWIEYEALPYVPHVFERLLLSSSVPYVVDYDDAVFHNYDLASNRLLRKALASKIDCVMAGAAAVICGNDYLLKRARDAGAGRLEQVPTVVDAGRYPAHQVSRDQSISQECVIGWIGSPSTERYIRDLAPVLVLLGENFPVRLVLVGASQSVSEHFSRMSVDVEPWSEGAEVELLSKMDIGLMPLPDGPWERGKCGYKLIQYMASGMPVVASPVGVNQRIVNEWDCGLLAADPEQWYDALSTLIADPAEANRLARNGRRAVEQYYSLQVQAPRLAEILRSAVSER